MGERKRRGERNRAERGNGRVERWRWRGGGICNDETNGEVTVSVRFRHNVHILISMIRYNVHSIYTYTSMLISMQGESNVKSL